VVQLRKGAGVTFLQLQASCEPSTTLWVSATNLKDRDLWAAGWLQMGQLEAGLGAAGGPCRACGGSGGVRCVACDATGAVEVAVGAPQAGEPQEQSQQAQAPVPRSRGLPGLRARGSRGKAVAE
jgi:hypothetical protein